MSENQHLRSRVLKSQLKSAFNAPVPTGRDAFLASASFPSISRAGFMLAQAGYIRKRVWAVSVLAALSALAVAVWLPPEQSRNWVWLISSLLPLVALVGIMEIARSASHNMEELEASCKYALPNIVLARLGALGAVNAFMLLGIALMFKDVTGYGLLRVGVYVSLPFLLTCALSLYALNRARSAEGVYICAAISVLVSALNGLGAVNFRAVYVNGNAMLWAALGVCVFVWMIFEMKKYLRESALP